MYPNIDIVFIDLFLYFISVLLRHHIAGMNKHVYMLNIGLVVLICLSTTFTSEFTMREFDGGPLYLINNNHEIF